jgi:hypothetical protein
LLTRLPYHTTISALPEAQQICQHAIALAGAFTIRQQRAYNASALFSLPPPSTDPCKSLRICEYPQPHSLQAKPSSNMCLLISHSNAPNTTLRSL